MELNVIVPDKIYIRQDEMVCFHVTDMRSHWFELTADLYVTPAAVTQTSRNPRYSFHVMRCKALGAPCKMQGQLFPVPLLNLLRSDLFPSAPSEELL